MFSTNAIIVTYINHLSSDSISPLCTWLLSTTPSTARITVDAANFGVNPNDYLHIGNGHNVTDDESIFVKVTGFAQAFTMVSSGDKVWIKYSMSGNGTSKRQFQIKLDSYNEKGIIYYIIYPNTVLT